MNRVVKAAVGAAILMASSGAFAAMPPVYSGASDLVLWVQAVNPTTQAIDGTYAFDTGENISTVFGHTFTSGASLVSLPGISASFNTIGAGATTLSSFLTSNSSDLISWAVEGGFYTGNLTTGAGNPQTKTTGAAEAIFTSALAPASTPNGVAALTGNSINNLLNGFAGATGGPSGAGAVESLVNFTNNASHTSTAATWSAGDEAHFGFVGNAGTSDAITTLGSPQTLYGITGNSPASLAGSALLQSYTLGTVSLSSAGVLTFASAVPLPGAVWLLGSGLLGLLGVSRRRPA